jgi:hypothetical protein
VRQLALIEGTIQFPALDAAIRAALSVKMHGLSSYGTPGPVVAWLDDAATVDDDATALAIAAAHDPVFLSADKTTIQADGVDTVTVSVVAPNVNAAPVNLLVNSQVVPVELTNGIGTVEIVSLDPARITVAVQSPANRTTDSVEVQAI